MPPDLIRVRIETRPKGEGTDVYLTYPEYPFCKPVDAPETWVCWMRGRCLLHVGDRDGPGVEFVEMTLNEEWEFTERRNDAPLA